MRLYAQVTSERDSRPSRKGGNEFIDIVLFRGNAEAYRIRFDDAGLVTIEK